MTTAISDADDLKEAGFVMEGIAQTLYAISAGEACRDIAVALYMLAKSKDVRWRSSRPGMGRGA